MFRNNNFVNKDGQNISFGRMHLNVGLGEYNIHFPCIREIWRFAHPWNSHISLGRCPREIWLFSGEQIFISPLCKSNECILFPQNISLFPYDIILFPQYTVLASVVRLSVLPVLTFHSMAFSSEINGPIRTKLGHHSA